MGAGQSALLEAVGKLTACDTVYDIQDVEFWERLWAQPLVPLETIFEHISIAQIHKIKDTCPKNLATLIRRAVLKLRAATLTAVAGAEAQAQVINVVRLLARIIPLVHEDPAWDGFWLTPTPTGVVVTMPPFSTDPRTPLEKPQSEPFLADAAPALPLFVTLLNAIIDLCFAPGFTVSDPPRSRLPFMAAKSEATEPLAHVDATKYAWAAGVAVTKSLPSSAAMDSRRADLLRLLLACLAKPLYVPPSALHPGASFWLRHLTDPVVASPKMAALVPSLLNSLLGYDAIGYGVPYGNVTSDDRDREDVAELSGQVLALLLDFQADPAVHPPARRRVPRPATASTAAAAATEPSPEPTASAAATTVAAAAAAEPTAAAAAAATHVAEPEAATAAATTTPEPAHAPVAAPSPRPVPIYNAALAFLAAVGSDADFDFVVRGARALLVTPLQSTWLPGSFKRTHMHTEVVILLWRLCECNPAFVAHLLKSSDCLDLAVPILHYLYEDRENGARAGFIQAGLYVLLLLSGERNFSVRLNKPFTPPFTLTTPVFDGHHGDFLLLVVHALMTAKNPHLVQFYDCLAIIIVNVSPFLKSMALVAANKLAHLFEVFSSPHFLAASEQSYQLMLYLLEAFNNVVQYQFEGNHHFVYVLVRRRAILERLFQLNFAALQPKPAAVAEPAATAETPAAAAAAHTSSATTPEPATGTPATAPEPDVAKRAQVWSSVPPSGDREHFTVEQQQQHHQQQRKAAQPDVDLQGQPVFEPTEPWFEAWKSKLPLETLRRMLHVLVPQIEKLCADRGVTDEAEILAYLKNGTLVGLLPTPHPILIRRFTTAQMSALWFSVFIWGHIFLSNMEPPMFQGTYVRLFVVTVVDA